MGRRNSEPPFHEQQSQMNAQGSGPHLGKDEDPRKHGLDTPRGDGMRAFEASQLLRLLARLHPELWEIIDPHVPSLSGQGRTVAPEPFVEGELNPQPLPPRLALRLAVLRTARAVADAAIAAHIAGRDVGEVLQEVGDDWCLTPVGKKIPWPRRWPYPWPPGEPFPIDPRLVSQAVMVEAALVFQSYASRIADERLSSAFGNLANRLTDAALVRPTASEGDIGLQ